MVNVLLIVCILFNFVFEKLYLLVMIFLKYVWCRFVFLNIMLFNIVLEKFVWLSRVLVRFMFFRCVFDRFNVMLVLFFSIFGFCLLLCFINFFMDLGFFSFCYLWRVLFFLSMICRCFGLVIGNYWYVK